VVQRGVKELAPVQEVIWCLCDKNQDAGQQSGGCTQLTRAGDLTFFTRLVAAMIGCLLGFVVLGHGRIFLRHFS
jgi:hypothetical protein